MTDYQSITEYWELWIATTILSRTGIRSSWKRIAYLPLVAFIFTYSPFLAYHHRKRRRLGCCCSRRSLIVGGGGMGEAIVVGGWNSEESISSGSLETNFSVCLAPSRLGCGACLSVLYFLVLCSIFSSVVVWRLGRRKRKRNNWPFINWCIALLWVFAKVLRSLFFLSSTLTSFKVTVHVPEI